MIAVDDPRHGHRAGYLAGCTDDTCPAIPSCAVAHRRYCKRWAAGPRRTTDTAKARAHVTHLLQTMGVSGIAEAAGLSTSTVRKVLADDRVHVRSVRRLLAVQSTTAGTWMPARGTSRRVQALNALGWSLRAIAEHSGLCEAEIVLLANAGDRSVRAETARAVAATYDAMSMRLPPTVTRPQRSAAGRARNSAAAKGWVPPLAWDDIDTDPAPAADVVVPRTQVVVEDSEFLALTGVELRAAATRLGYAPKTLERTLHRAGRYDLVTRLRDNEGRAAA